MYCLLAVSNVVQELTERRCWFRPPFASTMRYPFEVGKSVKSPKMIQPVRYLAYSTPRGAPWHLPSSSRAHHLQPSGSHPWRCCFSLSPASPPPREASAARCSASLLHPTPLASWPSPALSHPMPCLDRPGRKITCNATQHILLLHDHCLKKDFPVQCAGPLICHQEEGGHLALQMEANS